MISKKADSPQTAQRRKLFNAQCNIVRGLVTLPFCVLDKFDRSAINILCEGVDGRFSLFPIFDQDAVRVTMSGGFTCFYEPLYPLAYKIGNPSRYELFLSITKIPTIVRLAQSFESLGDNDGKQIIR